MNKKFKQYQMEDVKFGERKMSFVISTAAVDRDNDTIDPNGWNTEHYMKNPVVLWAHDYDQLPVAKATNVTITEKGLAADIQFPPVGTYPFADTVHDMLKAGFLNATSVGFKPVKGDQNTERKGFDYSSQELLEFSIVPVPSNPEALVTQRHSDVDELVVKGWCKAIAKWSSSRDAATNRTLELIVTHGSFADLAEDIEVETECGKKGLADGRLEKLVALHFGKKQAGPEPLTEDKVKAIVEAMLPKIEQKAVEPELIDFSDIFAEDEDDDEGFEIVSTQKGQQIEIADEQFTRLMRACVQDTVAEVIGGEVRSALNRLRGRVD